MTEQVLTAAQARENIGKFAFIVANGGAHFKAVHGRITEVDRANIWFIDNHDQPYYFKLRNVHHFKPMAFRYKMRYFKKKGNGNKHE